MRESFIQILDNCETLQESFNSMEEKQVNMDLTLEKLEDGFNLSKLDNSELRDDVGKIGGKLSSLNLEFQVDKGQNKLQMDDIAYRLVTQ